MSNRLINIAVYFLLSCLIFEHAVPFFMVQTRIIEVCHTKSDVENGEAKASCDDSLAFHDDPHLFDVLTDIFSPHSGSLFADSEEVSDSSHQAIFSPPPNEV